MRLCVYASYCNGSFYSTIGKAWQSMKAELRHRSEAHGKFVEQVYIASRYDRGFCFAKLTLIFTISLASKGNGETTV